MKNFKGKNISKKIKYFKTVFILFVLFSLNGCYELHYGYGLFYHYDYEVKRSDIAKKEEAFCFKKVGYLFYRKGSYASDGIFVKNIDCWYQDTISKRPFNSKELKLIKKQILSDTAISHKRHIGITIYDGIYQGFYYGTQKLNCNYYSLVTGSNGNAIIFPTIKLDDTIYINGVNDVIITKKQIKNIENKLLQQFDSISVKEAIKEFSEGRKIKKITYGDPIRN